MHLQSNGGPVDYPAAIALLERSIDLGDVFELIVDRFDQRTFAKEDFIQQGHQLVVHVLANLSDQLQALLPELAKQFGGNVTLVAE